MLTVINCDVYDVCQACYRCRCVDMDGQDKLAGNFSLLLYQKYKTYLSKFTGRYLIFWIDFINFVSIYIYIYINEKIHLSIYLLIIVHTINIPLYVRLFPAQFDKYSYNF